MNAIGFYSNAVHNPLQVELAEKLGRISGCEDYNLFLVSSGAEANENALKVASFYNQKSRVIAFGSSFHGRTSAAVAVTDNKKIIAPINAHNPVTILPLNDVDALEAALKKGDVSSVIIEAIQGVGGLDEGTPEFFKQLEMLCKQYEAVLILDEVQAGFGRSGLFFAFQHHNIQPDIITIAKGMGNGFPVGGVLIGKHIEAYHGMLGTTFGGNHLACAATIAVLDVLEKENLMANVREVSAYFTEAVKALDGVLKIKGKGLMLGLEFEEEVGALRKKLIYQSGIFTGGSMNKNLLRILPPLNVTKEQLQQFVEALKNSL